MHPRPNQLDFGIQNGPFKLAVKMAASSLEVGDILIFDGDVPHRGVKFDKRCIAAHAHLDVPGLDRPTSVEDGSFHERVFLPLRMHCSHHCYPALIPLISLAPWLYRVHYCCYTRAHVAMGSSRTIDCSVGRHSIHVLIYEVSRVHAEDIG